MVGNSTDGERDRTVREARGPKRNGHSAETDDRSTETDERESNPEAETE